MIYYTVPQIAEILGFPYLKALRWLRKHDALVRRGGRLVTTPAILRTTFPEVWQEIAMRSAEETDGEW